jgi:hypothetical protein
MELLIMGKKAVGYIFAEERVKLVLQEIYDKALRELVDQQSRQVVAPI